MRWRCRCLLACSCPTCPVGAGGPSARLSPYCILSCMKLWPSSPLKKKLFIKNKTETRSMLCLKPSPRSSPSLLPGRCRVSSGQEDAAPPHGRPSVPWAAAAVRGAAVRSPAAPCEGRRQPRTESLWKHLQKIQGNEFIKPFSGWEGGGGRRKGKLHYDQAI